MTQTKTSAILLAALFLLNPFAVSPVHASQGITELQSPDRVWAGESFTVTVRAQYDFEQGDVKIWARIRNSSNNQDMAVPSEATKLVSGKGQADWLFQLTAPGIEGQLRLEAYLIHWDKNQKETIDESRGFVVAVFAVPKGERLVEITGIQRTMPPNTLKVGETTPVIVSIHYRLMVNTRLQARIYDLDSHKEIGRAISELLSRTGDHTFTPINITPQRSGVWRLKVTVAAKGPKENCTTGLCALGDLAAESFGILVVGESTRPEFHYLIRTSPLSQSLSPDGRLTFDVFVILESGEPEQVTLNLAGLPGGSTYSFDPQAGKPSFNSKLSIYVPSSAAPGSYALSIAGDGGGLSKTIVVELIVKMPGSNMTQSPPTGQQTSTGAHTTETTTIAATTAGTAILAAIYYGVRKRRKGIRPPQSQSDAL